jgi:hypothetical protein
MRLLLKSSLELEELAVLGVTSAPVESMAEIRREDGMEKLK